MVHRATPSFSGRGGTSDRPSITSERMHAAVRLWILFIGLYELPEIFKLISTMAAKKPFGGFSSNMVPNPAEKRVWAFVLALLSTSRFVAVAWPESPVALTNLAVVHVIEAIFMLSEKLLFHSNGPYHILVVILLNAVGFSALAVL